MGSRHYDIAREDYNKWAIWLETASDLNTAEPRIEALTSFWLENCKLWINKMIGWWRRLLAYLTGTRPTNN
jgi:hypothetical protein